MNDITIIEFGSAYRLQLSVDKQKYYLTNNFLNHDNAVNVAKKLSIAFNLPLYDTDGFEIEVTNAKN